MSGAAQRFASVDALRGLTVAAMLLVNDPGDWGHVYAPLLHAEWNGFTPTDLVFPTFLFVVGVSIALGIVPALERGDARAPLCAHAWTRALRIIGIGLLLHALAWWWLDRDWFRPWGVLQRIGLCFGIAATIAIYLRQRLQWLLIAGLLLGYWWLLAGTGGTAQWSNLASRIDTAMLGPHAYLFDAASGRGHDPEGLLSTLPAIATTLLGVRAGHWLRQGQGTRLVLAALAALALGAAWSPWFPLNKNLWTSSYVAWTAGWSMLALAALHALVDVRGWPALGRSMGVNAIVLYAGSALMVYALAALGWASPIYHNVFVAPLAAFTDPRLPSLAFALAFTALWWGIAWWMHRRGIRVSV